MTPKLAVRPVIPTDLPVLHDIAGRAVRELLGGVYTAEQIQAAATVGVYEVEPELIDACTYWVVVIDGTVAASSGWSAGGSLRPDQKTGGPQGDRRGHVGHLRGTALGPARPGPAGIVGAG
jgi:hypothetical protein